MDELNSFRTELLQELKKSDAQNKICKALISKATAGETKAIELIIETMQEQKKDDKNFDITIRVVNSDETPNKEYTDIFTEKSLKT